MNNLEMYSNAVYTTQDDGAVVFYIDDEITVRTYGNNTLKNIYIFSGESYMVRHSVDTLRNELDITFPEINETVFLRMPKSDELIEACASLPMMADKRLVVISDCTVLTGKGSAEEAKRIAAYLECLPDTTVLVMCTETAPDNGVRSTSA